MSDLQTLQLTEYSALEVFAVAGLPADGLVCDGFAPECFWESAGSSKRSSLPDNASRRACSLRVFVRELERADWLAAVEFAVAEFGLGKFGTEGGACIGIRSGRSSSKRLRGGSSELVDDFFSVEDFSVADSSGAAVSGASSENHWSSSLVEFAFDRMPGTSTLAWHFGQSIREPAIDEGALSLALHCGQLIRIGSWDGWLTS